MGRVRTEERELELEELRTRQRRLAVVLSGFPWWDACGNRPGVGSALWEGVTAEAAGAGADRT